MCAPTSHADAKMSASRSKLSAARRKRWSASSRNAHIPVQTSLIGNPNRNRAKPLRTSLPSRFSEVRAPSSMRPRNREPATTSHRDSLDDRSDGHLLIEGREQDHDTVCPNALGSQVPARLAFVDERSGTPEDPASVRTRTSGRPRPGHRNVLSEERPTEPRSKRRRLGPTVLDPLRNPERHLPSPPREWVGEGQ